MIFISVHSLLHSWTHAWILLVLSADSELCKLQFRHVLLLWVLCMCVCMCVCGHHTIRCHVKRKHAKKVSIQANNSKKKNTNSNDIKLKMHRDLHMQREFGYHCNRFQSSTHNIKWKKEKKTQQKYRRRKRRGRRQTMKKVRRNRRNENEIKHKLNYCSKCIWVSKSISFHLTCGDNKVKQWINIVLLWYFNDINVDDDDDNQRRMLELSFCNSEKGKRRAQTDDILKSNFCHCRNEDILQIANRLRLRTPLAYLIINGVKKKRHEKVWWSGTRKRWCQVTNGERMEWLILRMTKHMHAHCAAIERELQKFWSFRLMGWI